MEGSADIGTGRMPFGIGVGAGTVVMVVACWTASVLSGPAMRLAVVAVAAAGCAAWLDDARAGHTVAGIGYLLFNGFLVNRFGELTWDGPASERHLVVLALAVWTGLAVRLVRRAPATAAGPAGVEAPSLITVLKEKESHGA